MTQAVTVRRDGDTFQARMFWLRAAHLLDPSSPVEKVGFETGPKGFDDIWIEYDATRSKRDQHGNALRREHIQCKWHGTPDSYGYRQLTDPEFINANARSLLERAQAAQHTSAANGVEARFTLLTNWQIDRADPLREIVNTRSNTVRLDRLFATATDRSKTGAIRKLWREHLGINDAELRLFAGCLAFGQTTESLDDLRDRLDWAFACVGLRRIPPNESAFPYDDLVFQWLAQDRLDFDRESFRLACFSEGLLSTGSAPPRVFGVKSFEHPIDRLQDRCIDVLDFTPEFAERYIQSGADWADKLYPALKTFLLGAARRSEHLRLAIDAHATVAFAAGSVLDIKSGRLIELEQRTTSTQVWSADDNNPDPTWPLLESEVVEIADDRPGLAVAIGLTHDIARDVRSYVERSLPSVGRILACRPGTNPGARSVLNGRHAFDLAEAVTGRIRATLTDGGYDIAHLFVAAPNAFTFFLGQRHTALGQVRLYEFDFDGLRDRSYRLSLCCPVA